MLQPRDRFDLPPLPHTGLELLLWILNEPNLPASWVYGLQRRAAVILYTRALPWICIISFLLWLTALVAIAGLELPLRFPEQFQNTWQESLRTESSLHTRVFALFLRTWLDWALGVGTALAVASVLALAGELAGAVKIGIAGSLSLGLLMSLAGGIAGGLAWSAALGLGFGLAWAIIFSIGLRGLDVKGYAVGSLAALGLSLFLVLLWGVPVAVAAFLSVLIPSWEFAAEKAWQVTVGLVVFGCAATIASLPIILRLPLYLPQAAMALLRLDLRHSPYLRDARVILPGLRLRPLVNPKRGSG